MALPSYRLRFSYIDNAREAIIATIAEALQRLSKPEKQRICEELQDMGKLMGDVLEKSGEKRR